MLMNGRMEVVVRLADGTTMRMPWAWTDVDGMPPEPVDESVFTAEALRELLDRVACLRGGT